GFKPVDLPGVPVRALAFTAARLPAPAARIILRKGLGTGRGGKMPSFHIDLHSGKGRSEVDDLNGAVVRFGAEHHIPTPVNRILTETLLRLTTGEEEPAVYARQPDKLLKLAGYQ
ncbi:MAG: 2-dehydropantoate 2-reductase, partial [Chloroflexota bacterium]